MKSLILFYRIISINIKAIKIIVNVFNKNLLSLYEALDTIKGSADPVMGSNQSHLLKFMICSVED
jgi:hypothetical protein